MSIAAANLTFLGQGPATLAASKALNLVSTASTALPQVTAYGDDHGSQAGRLMGYATFTGATGSTTAVLNYIDGTVALNFTPQMIVSARCGGTATATTEVVSVVDAANGNKTATVTFSASFDSTTIVVGVELYPA